jgi:hypothetical protein
MNLESFKIFFKILSKSYASRGAAWDQSWPKQGNLKHSAQIVRYHHLLVQSQSRPNLTSYDKLQVLTLLFILENDPMKKIQMRGKKAG